MSTFSQKVCELLINGVQNGKIDASIEEVSKIMLRYEKINGEMRYLIEDGLLNKIPDEIKDEIESAWISDQHI